MAIKLETLKLISRKSGVARSIKVLVWLYELRGSRTFLRKVAGENPVVYRAKKQQHVDFYSIKTKISIK
jgi:hypothetical protein